MTGWTAIEIFVAASMAACLEKAVPLRKDDDLAAKLVGLGALLVLILAAWVQMSNLRPWLLVVPFAACAFRRGRSRGRLDGARRLLLRLGSPFVVLLGMLLALNAGDPSSVATSAKSPDGRWEARLVEHPGFAYCVDEIVLVPQGVPTLNPLAYPSVSLGETVMEGELDHMGWADADTLVLFLRPQTAHPPYLVPNSPVQVKVVNLPLIAEAAESPRIIDITPPDTPSRAASRRLR